MGFLPMEKGLAGNQNTQSSREQCGWIWLSVEIYGPDLERRGEGSDKRSQDTGSSLDLKL